MAEKAAEKSGGFRLKIPPKQAVVIGLLFAVLGYVLFSGEDKSAATADPSAATTESQGPASRRKPLPRSTPAVPLRRPEIVVDQIVKQNPFAKLSAPAKPESEKVVAPPAPAIPVVRTPTKEEIEAQKLAKERDRRTQQAIADLQGQKVKMILRTDNKASAMIGNRLVTEGEVFDGIKIISILPQGVIIKRVSAD